VWSGSECEEFANRGPRTTYLGVIDLAGAEEGVQRVVAGNDEASNVDEELAGDVEKDEEEVQAGETEDGVDLGDRRLPLQVVEDGELGQLHRATLLATTFNGAQAPHSDSIARLAASSVHVWGMFVTCASQTYLFVELRQRLLGALLCRHGDDCEEWLDAVLQKLEIWEGCFGEWWYRDVATCCGGGDYGGAIVGCGKRALTYRAR
jgi:hypothetical protein